jgi:hypothetical protein
MMNYLMNLNYKDCGLKENYIAHCKEKIVLNYYR